MPVGVIAMPFGLTRKTWPLPVILPAIDEVVSPVTRLRIAESEFGWTKLTAAPAATEKLFQFTIARDDTWLTVSELVFGAKMLTCPEATDPPCGSSDWAAARGVNTSIDEQPRRAVNLAYHLV